MTSLLYGEARFPEVEAILAPPRHSFTVTSELARAIARLVILGGRRNVLEFGAGVSSVVTAQALSLAGGGRLTSLDHDTSYCRESWATVTATPDVDAQLTEAKLKLQLTRAGLLHCYEDAETAITPRGPYDLVVVDAPPQAYGRDAAMWLAHRHLAPGCLIVLDDAGRRREKVIIRHWVRQYPGLELLAHSESFGGRGVAMLQYDGRGTCRTRVMPLLNTVRERWHSRAKVAQISQ